MTPIAGSVALNLAFGFSLLSIITLYIYIRNGDKRLFLTGQRLSLGISFFVFLSTFILWYLEHQPFYYVFDDNYILKIIDGDINYIELDNTEYIKISSTEYKVLKNNFE